MNEKKGWGSTVMGWFVVRDGMEGGETVSESPEAPPPADAPPPVALTHAPAVGEGGAVDFAAVFASAGIDNDEQGRVNKARELLAALPAETPQAVKKQIVEASLKAFGVPINKIIEDAVAEIEALEAYIQKGRQDTQAILSEASGQIAELQQKILDLQQIMDKQMKDQEGMVRHCNGKKLEIQRVLEFFGQEAVAQVVKESPRLHEPEC